MINNRLLFIIACYVVSYNLSAQGYDRNWITGMHELPGVQGYNNALIRFLPNGSIQMDTIDLGMNIESTVATMSDSAGNLLFFTNGCYIAQADGHFMPGGEGLNPGQMHDWVCGKTGYVSPRGAMAIPAPGSNHLYYLFHSGVRYDPVRKNTFGPFYYSLIDMDLDNGKGAVVSKNNILADGDLEPFTAVRHGNGRDWWLLVPHFGSNRYDLFLLSADGIQLYLSQEIGPVMDCRRIGSAAFSPQGDRFARVQNCIAAVFHFNRCSGLLSQPIAVARPVQTLGGGGVAFSPDGNHLLVTSQLQVFQADLNLPNPVLDTAFAWNLYWGISLQYLQYAPDGRLWANHMHRTNYFSTIDHPENLGTSIGFQAKGVQLPVFQLEPCRISQISGCMILATVLAIL